MVHDMIHSASYMAHGYCLLWKPWLVALHAGSDLVIFGAYFAIPVAIWIFLRQRPDVELRPLAVLFAAFIFLCGLTHVVQMLTLWWPIYETQGYLKVVTAAVSAFTAVMMFPLIPKALAIPSPRTLQAANDGMKREIEAHQLTLARLQEARGELERRVTERTRELASSKARLEALITASAQIVWTRDVDERVETDSPSWRAFTGQTYQEWQGKGWLDVVHPEDRQQTRDAWEKAIADKTTYSGEYRLRHASGEYRWTMARSVPLLADDGSVTEWVGMNEDITDRKRNEEQKQLVMRELSHRTKNLLAVIASLVRRTFDGKRDPLAQAADFIERIHGLARSHDLLVSSDWRGVQLRDLVASHLEPFGLDAERVVVNGPPVEIKPEVAQNLGLAIHELATNATKHGILKGTHGRIQVSWKIGCGPQPTLEVEWLEETVTPTKPLQGGFGSTVLEQLVAASLGGSAEYEIANGRLIWKMNAPLDRIVTADSIS